MTAEQSKELLLSVQGLKKNFGEREILKGIDFDVHKGDVVCVIGPSGSGKSTLIRCVNYLEQPTDGVISYRGENVLECFKNLPLYRTKVGMVFQQFNLFNNMTVLENCVVGQVKVLGKKSEEAKAIAMKYLFCVLLALSLAACGKETEDPGLSREEFLDFFPLHEHGEVYVEPFYVRFYYPGGNCLLFPTDILGESPAPPVQYMFLHLDGSDVPPAELIDRAYGVDCAAATTALSFLPDAAGGNYLVADFRYRYAAEQGTQIGERVGEWRIVWGVQRQYRYNGKLYPRVEFQ